MPELSLPEQTIRGTLWAVIAPSHFLCILAELVAPLVSFAEPHIDLRCAVEDMFHN